MHNSYYVWGSKSKDKATTTLYPHHYRTSQPFFWIESRDNRNNATTAMASSISTAVILPLGFRNSFQNQAVRAVRLSPFAMKISHNLSFTRSVSGFAPTVVQRVPIVASPSRNNPKPLTIVAAKGYKMKTHKVKFFFVRIWSFCVFCELRFLCP